MTGTPSPIDISTRLQRIAELARTAPTALTTLAHHIDVDLLREAYRRTRKDGAVGVDGLTAATYSAANFITRSEPGKGSFVSGLKGAFSIHSLG